MDKQKNGNTITIKINGKHGTVTENKLEKPPIKQKKEKERVEQQLEYPEPIEQESAAAKEEEGDTFDWILPSGNTLPKNEESKIIHLKDKKKEKLTKPFTALLDKTNKPKKEQSKIKGIKTINMTMLFSIIFAVILGTFFGIILLKLVPTDQVVGGEEKPAVVKEQEQAAEQPNQNANVEVTLKPLQMVVVQEGVYSSQGAAETIVASLKEKGTPSEIIPIDGKFAIFVSVAETVADAKSLGQQIEGNGIKTFSKEFTIDEKKISLQHEEEKKLLEMSPQLFKTLTASAATAGISNSIPQAAMENISKESVILSEIDKDKLQNKAVIDIYSQLETAVSQIKHYEKNPEAGTLNKIQQSLLSFMAAYASL